MGKIGSLKLEITSRSNRLTHYLQDMLSYNFKRAFMALFLIFAAEIFWFTSIHYSFSNALELVTFIFVLFGLLDIPKFLENKQIPRKVIDLDAVDFLNDKTLTITFKNISMSFSGYPNVHYIILKGKTAVLDEQFTLRNLSPSETHRILVDVSNLDIGTKYSVHVIIDKYTHRREFEM